MSDITKTGYYVIINKQYPSPGSNTPSREYVLTLFETEVAKGQECEVRVEIITNPDSRNERRYDYQVAYFPGRE